MAGIASFIIGVAWWVLTFFVVPIIVLERASVLDSMGKSPELFRGPGEMTLHIGTGLLMTLCIFILAAVSVPLMMLGDGSVLG